MGLGEGAGDRDLGCDPDKRPHQPPAHLTNVSWVPPVLGTEHTAGEKDAGPPLPQFPF